MHCDRFPLCAGTASPVKMSNYRAEPSSPCHVLVAPTPELSRATVSWLQVSRRRVIIDSDTTSSGQSPVSSRNTQALKKKAVLSWQTVRESEKTCREWWWSDPESPASLTQHCTSARSWVEVDWMSFLVSWRLFTFQTELKKPFGSKVKRLVICNSDAVHPLRNSKVDIYLNLTVHAGMNLRLGFVIHQDSSRRDS